MVAVALATRLPFFGHPAADYDEQLYDLIGSRLLDGHLPYLDMWDRKPLGLFAIYAVGHLVGGNGPVGYQMLALLFCIAGGWQCHWLARRLADPVSAAFASALYPLMMALLGNYSGQSEVFFMPVAMAMAQLLFVAESRPGTGAALKYAAAAMLCGGLVLQIKYTALFQCLYFGALALAILWRKGWRWRGLAASAALFAVLGIAPTALVALIYWANGGLDEFIFANFLSIGRRTTMPLERTLVQQILFVLPLVILAAGGAAYALAIRPETRSRNWWLAIGWFMASVAGLFMGTTVYVYYYAALVPAAIVAAMPMFDCRQMMGRLLLGGVLVTYLAMFGPLGHASRSAGEKAELAAIAERLRPHVGKGRPLYIYDGPVALYRLTGSELPTRLIYPDHLNNQLEAKALPVDPVSEIHRIFALRPGAVITTDQEVTVRNRATAQAVADELAAHYRPIGALSFQKRKFDLYVLRAPAPGE